MTVEPIHLRFGPTPLTEVRRVDGNSEIPPVEGIDELFLVAFKIGDKEHKATFTREDAVTIYDTLDVLLDT